ncbi:MAG: acyl-CoA synthetase [Acidimicrobiia bacterium]
MNAGSYLTRAARHHPDGLGAVFGEHRLTWAELNGRANAFAAGLRRLGVRPGERVGLCMTNSHRYLEALFGTFKAGAAAVPINYRLTADEVTYHLSDPRASAVVASAEFADLAEVAAAQVPSLEHRIVTSGARPGQHDYETFVSETAKAGDDDADVAGDDLAWLFYTSGTTGRPKGVMLTHAVIRAATVGAAADLVPFSPEHRMLHSAPLSHGAGFVAIAATSKATANIILDKFDPALVCQVIERERVTAAWFVPTQIKMLANSPEIDRRDLSSLAYVVYGGAPMYLEDLQFALRRMGRVFVQLFGQGESPMTGTYLRREEHVIDGTEEETRRMLSAGIARTDIEVRIVDEDDRPVDAGESGEICLRGPTVMKGYWERPDDTAHTLRGGWLHTGDVGYQDERGYLYVVDRMKDMVISGGMNIYPREVEEALCAHPAVFECSVIGVPDPKWGEAVKAVVVLRPDATATEAELIEHCKASLASFKKPSSVDFVDDIPKSGYGKILKRQLRERYWAGHTRRV